MRTLVEVLTFLVVLNGQDGHWVEWNTQQGCEEIPLYKIETTHPTAFWYPKRYQVCPETAWGHVVFILPGEVDMPSPSGLFVPEAAWAWWAERKLLPP